MKVITQLVQHFWSVGADGGRCRLPCPQRFCPARSIWRVLSFRPMTSRARCRDSVNTPTPVGVRALEAVQESLVRRGKRRRKERAEVGRPASRGNLCERVKAEFATRAGDLESLLLACPKPSAGHLGIGGRRAAAV